MGFLRRFFSLRHKQKAARPDCRPDPPAADAPQEKKETLDITHGERYSDERATFRPTKPRKESRDEDADTAVSRLLRSSSAHYNIVAQADFAELPPLPHPINTIASRSTSALTLTPSRTASVQTRGSFRVTVHKRQLLSATIFPNAYPPLTPRRPGIAHTSTPNLLATCSDSANAASSTSTSAVVGPRKIPFTPHDANRLSRLRQDPSVASLVKMYDDHGRLADSAFANTPAPMRRKVKLRKSRRKSTFTELLACEGSAEADVLWAESCLAQQGATRSDNSASNASSTSLSSTSTSPLDSPATSTFNDAELGRGVPAPGPALARDPSGSDTTETEKEDGFSSLAVELSTATSSGPVDVSDRSAPHLGPYRYPKQKDKWKGKENALVPEQDDNREGKRQRQAVNDSDSLDNGQGDQTLGSKVGRRPSHRASQIFNFIGERRERRKSQELLQSSAMVASTLAEELAHSNCPSEPMTSNPVTSKLDSISRAKSPTPLNLAGSMTNAFGSRTRAQSKWARPSLDADPAPAPPSPVTIQPLCPAPRPNSRATSSCSRATGTTMRSGSSASTASQPVHLPAPGLLGGKSTKGSTAVLATLQAECEQGNERKIAEAPRLRHIPEANPLPQTSTPHPSKIARVRRALKVTFDPRDRGRGRATLGEVTNALVGQDEDEFRRESFERRHDIFAASLDLRTQQMQIPAREKENATTASRRRGPALDLGLTRAATTTLSRAFASKHAHAHRGGPQTPTRSQSLRAPDYSSSRSSSELPPTTNQLIAESHARRAMVRLRAERGKQPANVA